MHLQIVIAFALLLWWPEKPPAGLIISDPTAVFLFVGGKLLVFGAAAQWLCRFTQKKLANAPTMVNRTLSLYHRLAFILRLALLAGVAADMLLTGWPAWLASRHGLGFVPGWPQLCLLVPYVVGLAMTWWLLYPVEQTSRDPISRPSRAARWRYVVFNLRHQVLIIALPLSVIVITYMVTQEHERWLIRHIGSPWAPEAVLGAVAVTLFILSPLMLRRIWATSPLPDGPLRRKLLDLCDDIGLKVREILVWHSDGMVVNAAVMGLFPRVRYILLSDLLLESMTDEEIEAVFGHEAGHVRFHHIQYFLFFALVSTLIVSGVMEFLTRMAHPGLGASGWPLSQNEIQGIGMMSVIPIWGIAFGWISRRFERQADVFGAFCASPTDDGDACKLPCVIHDHPMQAPRHAVCASGSRTFVAALQKVAVLNGIPPAERSWRHSSIASRMQFLTALSGDPVMTRRFARCIRRIKLTLVVCCAVGVVVAASYIWQHPGYRRAVRTSILEPVKKLISGDWIHG